MATMTRLLVSLLRQLIPIAQKILGQAKAIVGPTRSFYFKSANGKQLEIQAYIPSGAPPDQGWPIHINLQGAGFCLPCLGADALFCSYIMREANIVVLDVDYSKAPENPWPAATNDIFAALDWIMAAAAEQCWNTERMTIGGFSSGGCLSLLVASQKPELFKGVITFYASTNLAEDPAKKPKVDPSHGAGQEMPVFLRKFFYACYLPAKIDRSDSRVSPLYADPKHFPDNITTITCQEDALGREGEQLAEKLREQGGKNVVWYRADRQGHAWDKEVKLGSDDARIRDESYELARQRICEALAVDYRSSGRLASAYQKGSSPSDASNSKQQ